MFKDINNMCRAVEVIDRLEFESLLYITQLKEKKVFNNKIYKDNENIKNKGVGENKNGNYNKRFKQAE
ncbi:hypothetical protein HERIO_2649 [Hepatospora eriocheir]|uniref:Uncharacterized protein n=1 Tax=Hepatospora eriocheir TaxID=1081669 RepID=A0A1X0Q5F8_9MICR|nr:hypothetical protein HERIO_2649 [Hepatospora eriocheir]